MLHHYQTVSKRRIPCIGLTEEHPPETEVPDTAVQHQPLVRSGAGRLQFG